MSTIHKEAGYWSLGVLYLVFAFSNIIAAPIENVLGPRITLLVASIPYWVYVLSAAFTYQWLLITSAAVLGFAAAFLWTAHGV